jgi:GT2 family glycosyltransferase
VSKNRGNPILFILIHAFSWLFFAPNRGKLAKIWATYKLGGMKLCWHRAVEGFGWQRYKYKYDYKGNQLSQVQSNYIISRCLRKPLFSIIVPVYRVNYKWLDKCIGSVVNQHYTNWELILVDDASERDELKQLMDVYASKDKRIRVYCLEQNLGIAGATNFGIKQAKGEFIGYLDHDDELTPDALTWVVWTLNKHPGALWLYSDEDLLTTAGKCHSPRFKPDFSPEFLLSSMFACHFRVYSADLIRHVSSERQGFDGSQDHDLALRISEIVRRDQVVHIPRILYHWRTVSTSAAAGIGNKPQASIAGQKAVSEALKRRGLKSRVTSYSLCPTLYQIKLEPTQYPKVSIIIPTKNALELLRKCLLALRSHTHYPNYEVIIIDNQSNEPAFRKFVRQEQANGGLSVIRYDKPFNHSEMNNIAVASVDSEFVLLMNNDIEIISDDWLEQLIATAQMDNAIAAVGALLIYPDGKVQHGGIVLGLCGAAGHAHKYIDSKMPGYHGRLHALQEMSGVTAALALVQRSSFEHIGGFESNRYPTLYNDVDLCIRLRKKGYRCIYNPMVRAIHYETKTRRITTAELIYRKRLKEDYADILDKDPFYNPNLPLDNEQFHGFRLFPIEEQIPELRDIQKQSV